MASKLFIVVVCLVLLHGRTPTVSQALGIRYVQTVKELVESNNTFTGELAYVAERDQIAVKLKQGWRSVLLGDRITPSEQVTPSDEFRSFRFQPATEILASSTASPSVNSKEIGERTPALIIAALNEPHSGNFKVKEADLACYRQARQSKLPGTFRAFLASRLQDLDAIVDVKHSRFPIINTKGDILYNSWRELFVGQGIPYTSDSAIYSFDGRNVHLDNTWPMKLIWHGADSNGARNLLSNCRDWSSESMSHLGKASVFSRSGLLGQEMYSCNNRFIVLCVQATSNVFHSGIGKK